MRTTGDILLHYRFLQFTTIGRPWMLKRDRIKNRFEALAMLAGAIEAQQPGYVKPPFPEDLNQKLK